MILDATETVLGYFGFDRKPLWRKEKYRDKKMKVAVGAKQPLTNVTTGV